MRFSRVMLLPAHDGEIGLDVLDMVRPAGDLDGPVALRLTVDVTGQEYHPVPGIDVDLQPFHLRVVEEPRLDRRCDDGIVDVLAKGAVRLRRIPLGGARPDAARSLPRSDRSRKASWRG